MNAQSYIDALNKETGLDIFLPPTGAVAFALEGRNLLIQWIEATQSFVVYAEVGTLNGWRNEEICRQLLSANFLLFDTHGGAFSYEPNTNVVGLNFQLPSYGLDTAAFIVALNNIILFSDDWAQRLQTMNAGQEKAVNEEQQAILDNYDAFGDARPHSANPSPLSTFVCV